MSLSAETIQAAMLAVVTMVLSGTVHEWAHAFAAFKLGDDTAARQGRLTLNPTTHIDPFGTLLMPAVGIAWAGFLFGYMRPVPFNPSRFTRKLTMQMGTLIVAAAGPISNLVLAVLCSASLALIPLVAGQDAFQASDTANMVGVLLYTAVWLNVVLFLFNLLPIYPLDGSKILEAILPRRHHRILEFLQQNSLIMMVLVFAIGARFLGPPIRGLVSLILQLFGLSDLDVAPLRALF